MLSIVYGMCPPSQDGPYERLLAYAKFCAPDDKIENIVKNLGDWVFFTDNVKIQNTIINTSHEYIKRHTIYDPQPPTMRTKGNVCGFLTVDDMTDTLQNDGEPYVEHHYEGVDIL